MEESFAEHRIHVEPSLEASSTAVLVVDMLNDFLEDGGRMVLPVGRRLYEAINTLLEAARESGTQIIWLCDEHPPVDGEFRKRTVHCLRGSWGAQIVDGLTRRPDEERIPKRRFSGFFETDLDLRLRELGIRTVIVVGIVTNICVRSTVHDAFFRGYDVIVPRDCVAATGEREQESSLYDIGTHFGEVADLARVLDMLQSTGTRQPCQIMS